MSGNPAWTEETVIRGADTLRGYFGEYYQPQLAEADKGGADAGFWAQQFDITKRAASSQKKRILSKIDNYVGDYHRVTRILRGQWGDYIGRVRMQRGPTTAERVEALAKEGPPQFYYFLVTDLIFRAWQRHSPSMEHSISTIRAKIGYDNQMLYSEKELETLLRG